MATRSVKRARQVERQRASEPPPERPATPAAHRSRHFWLGALVAAALLVPFGIQIVGCGRISG